MTKHLKDMSLSELKAGYEKGKVTDEEIEQHLLEQVQNQVRKVVIRRIESDKGDGFWAGGIQLDYHVAESVQKLAEHEYQKLKDK